MDVWDREGSQQLARTIYDGSVTDTARQVEFEIAKGGMVTFRCVAETEEDYNEWTPARNFDYRLPHYRRVQ